MSCMGFGMAGSRRIPRGKQKLGACKPIVQRKDPSDLETRRTKQEAAARCSPDRPRVFLELAIGGEVLGRVVCELFSDIVPRTSENFRLLCTGTKGLGQKGRPLHYKGCVFHRVVPNRCLQGGDIIKGDGTSGESIYGHFFDDESFDLSHSSAGLLSMVNDAPNKNNSQFFITTKADTSLDGKHVIFGRVEKGMEIVERIMSTCGTSGGGSNVGTKVGAAEVMSFRPAKPAYITDCGDLSSQKRPSVAALALKDAEEGRLSKRLRSEEDAVCELKEVYLYHLLKKHRFSPRPANWRGEEVTCTKGKARIAVENARKRLVAAPTIHVTFVELAREHSDESSGQHGGDLGLVERGVLTPEVEDVAFALKVGQLSDVFETSDGVHLLLRTA